MNATLLDDTPHDARGVTRTTDNDLFILIIIIGGLATAKLAGAAGTGGLGGLGACGSGGGGFAGGDWGGSAADELGNRRAQALAVSTEDVLAETLHVAVVATREIDQVACGATSSTTGDDKVDARWVELGLLWIARGDVEGDDLVAQQILSRCKVVWNANRGTFTIHDALLQVLTVALPALLLNLEKLELGWVLAEAFAIAAGKVVLEFTSVMRPALPANLDLITCSDSNVPFARCGVRTAGQSGIVEAVVGVDVGHGPDCRVFGTAAGSACRESLAFVHHVGDGAMGRDVDGCEEREEESNSLHSDGMGKRKWVFKCRTAKS